MKPTIAETLTVWEAQRERFEAEKAAHAVTMSRLEFLEGYRSVVEPELEATRKEWAKQEHIANEYRAQNEELDLKLQELESLRKPLEGELAEDVAIIQRALSDATLHAADAFVRIKAALRAKGEPQAVDEKRKGHERLSEQVRATLSEFDRQREQAAEPLTDDTCVCGEAFSAHRTGGVEHGAMAHGATWENGKFPQYAAEPPEPRAIVVGSKWRHTWGSPKGALGVRRVEAIDVHGLGHIKVEGISGAWASNFRNEWEWVSDPELGAPSLKGMPVTIDDSDPPATPAPELPRQPCKDCGGCGMIHYRARGGSITGSGPCPCRSASPATEPQ